MSSGLHMYVYFTLRTKLFFRADWRVNIHTLINFHFRINSNGSISSVCTDRGKTNRPCMSFDASHLQGNIQEANAHTFMEQYSCRADGISCLISCCRSVNQNESADYLPQVTLQSDNTRVVNNSHVC